MSILTPKAFSIRKAISGDKAAWQFTRSDSVARRTPKISAARATDRPSSASISSRMNSPGCDGFMPTLVISSLISDSPLNQDRGFRRDDFKGDPPIVRNRNAPRSGSVAGKLVDAPAGRTFEPLDV